MAQVLFDNQQSLDVEESIGEVEASITALGAVITPMIRLTEKGSGETVLVFASQIRYVREQRKAHPLRNQG